MHLSAVHTPSPGHFQRSHTTTPFFASNSLMQPEYSFNRDLSPMQANDTRYASNMDHAATYNASQSSYNPSGHSHTNQYPSDRQIPQYPDPSWPQPPSFIRVNTTSVHQGTFHSYPSASTSTNWSPYSPTTDQLSMPFYPTSHYHGTSTYSDAHLSSDNLTSTSPHSPVSLDHTPSPHEGSTTLANFSVPRQLYTHRQQLQFFRDAPTLQSISATGPFIPQPMYKPHTNSDRRRYVEEVDLDAPIYFWASDPNECGIPLIDALHSRVRRLMQRDEPVFEGRGPSVSIRLEWPGYRQWSRQIPTKDFRSPPGPITRAKLAKNVAKCVQRFISERQNHMLDDDVDRRWRVGTGFNEIKLDDLVLVSIHHVSMGSWQPHLRLRRPLPQ